MSEQELQQFIDEMKCREEDYRKMSEEFMLQAKTVMNERLKLETAIYKAKKI